ncbi:MAG: hypothetical protein AABZ14_06895 [Candidatus Margulisiibacteriota bacterium]
MNTKLISIVEPSAFTLNDYLKLWRLTGPTLGTVSLRQPTILRTNAEIEAHPEMADQIGGISIPTKETFLNIQKFNESFGPFTNDDFEAIKTWAAHHKHSVISDIITQAEAGQISIENAASKVYMMMLMAHEMGHHKWIPYDYKTSMLIIDSVYKVTQDQDRAAHIANVYEDLVINNNLLMERGLPMHMLYLKMTAKNESVSPFWMLYMRTYEQLWPVMILSDAHRKSIPSGLEADAKTLTSIIRDSEPRNYVSKAHEAAAIINKYYDDKDKRTPAPLDGETTGKKQSASGQPKSGKPKPSAADKAHQQAKATAKKVAEGMSRKQEQEPGAGTIRSLPEFQDLMQRMGLADNIKEATMDYYLDLAHQYAVQFPSVPRHHGSEIMEGVADWDPSMDPLERLDMALSLQQGIVIPGLTTVQREWVEGFDIKESIEPPDLMLYVDASGSMPNPNGELSPLVLAATIAMESALNAGKQVRACNYDSHRKYTAMETLSDDQRTILQYLLSHNPSESRTTFPFQDLTHIYNHYQNEPVHLVVISDNEFLDSLSRDYDGKKGLQIMTDTLLSRKGGGTLFLSAELQQIVDSFPGLDTQIHSIGHNLQKVDIPSLNLTIYPIAKLDDLAYAAEDMAQATYNPYGYSEMIAAGLMP